MALHSFGTTFGCSIRASMAQIAPGFDAATVSPGSWRLLVGLRPNHGGPGNCMVAYAPIGGVNHDYKVGVFFDLTGTGFNGTSLHGSLLSPWGTLPHLVPKTDWPTKIISCRLKYSTWDDVALTWAADGELDLRIDDAVVYSVTGQTLTFGSPTYFFTHGRQCAVAMVQCGISDGPWWTTTEDYPTFVGAQHVPVGSNIKFYFDFADMTMPAGWTVRSSVGLTELPLFRPDGGLDNTAAMTTGTAPMSISNWDSDNYDYLPFQGMGFIDSFEPVVTTGSLSISKSLETPDPTAEFLFTCGPGLDPATFTLKGGESRLYSGVVPGSGYFVTESPATGWVQTGVVISNGSPGAIVVAADVVTTVAFSNALTPFTPSGCVPDWQSPVD